jgi:peptidoglycan/LPS O-acetylase OafA/YrhL
MIGLGIATYAAITLWSYWSWVYFERPARRAIDAIGTRERRAPQPAEVNVKKT